MAEDGESTSSSAIWAVALIIIVAIVMGALYYGGVLSGKPGKDTIEVNVTVPAR